MCMLADCYVDSLALLLSESLTVDKYEDQTSDKARAFIGLLFFGLVTQSIEDEMQNDNQATAI